MTTSPRTLEQLMAQSSSLASADLRTRLQWIEDAAAALDGEDLGDVGKQAALQLRAALGAVIKWSQGPKDPATLAELEVLVRTLLARGQWGMCRALADAYRALSRAPSHPNRAACASVADAYDDVARALYAGTPPPASARETIARVDAALRDQQRS